MEIGAQFRSNPALPAPPGIAFFLFGFIRYTGFIVTVRSTSPKRRKVLPTPAGDRHTHADRLARLMSAKHTSLNPAPAPRRRRPQPHSLPPHRTGDTPDPHGPDPAHGVAQDNATQCQMHRILYTYCQLSNMEPSISITWYCVRGEMSVDSTLCPRHKEITGG